MTRKNLSDADGTTGGVPYLTPTLGELLAERLGTIRREAGLTQDEVARAAARRGLKWRRLTVRDLEAGTRRIALEEWPLLPVVFHDLGVGTLQPRGPRFLRNSDRVRLPDGSEVDGATVLRWMGQRPDPDEPTVDELEESRAVLDRHMTTPAPDEAESKATSRLRDRLERQGLSVVDVQLAAERLWDGRRLAVERDRRIEDRDDLTPRRLQAARGVITRALLDELAQELTTGRQGRHG